MKIKLLTLFGFLLLLNSCSGDDSSDNTLLPAENNKVLLLKVDYMTNAFEGGKELTFDNFTDDFTVDVDYQAPGDFGSITLKYHEADAMLFSGQIHWMGLGKIQYPEAFAPASAFDAVMTEDFVSPAGFENVFNPSSQEFDYMPVWSHVQNLVKVRQYLASNPGANAKLFLYTPSVGVGNPAEWDWIIILKN